ncbi:MAG TPA: mechanosensitive ion channel domain-containing protein [Candidatus Bathyarchaeia archaeon]|nr:mechanosensitive ion channel domain-containing protein [Candidatus Bathyarchaeia archaeon]
MPNSQLTNVIQFNNANLITLGERIDNFKIFFKDIWTDILAYFQANGYKIIMAIVVIIVLLVVTVIIERLSTRLIRKFGRKNEWADEVINGIAFIGRLFIVITGVGLVTAFGGLPEELGITITAIFGAAIGLSSTQTIGNIIAGFTVLLSRPFSLGDYVQIGDSEGVVTEVTINYTKIQTKNDRTILVTNREMSSSKIVKFGTDKISKAYTIYPAFNYDITTKQLAGIFKKIIDKYTPERVIEIRYELVEVTNLMRKYEVSFVFDFVDDYFTIPSEFLEDVMEEYDKVKLRNDIKKQS